MARRRTRAEFQAAVDHYAPLLGLSDWWIETRIGYNAEEGQAADVECKPRNKYALIMFYPHEFSRQESHWFTFNGVVLHELIHVKLSPMVFALRGEGADIESQARGYFSQELTEEPLVAELERLLLRWLPKPPRF